MYIFYIYILSYEYWDGCMWLEDICEIIVLLISCLYVEVEKEFNNIIKFLWFDFSNIDVDELKVKNF